MLDKNLWTLEYWENQGVKIFDKIPDGYKLSVSLSPCPKGYKWIYDEKALFMGEYNLALLKVS